MEIHVVYTEREHRYLPVEGVYTDIGIARHVANLCSGQVITRTLDEDSEELQQGLKSFTCAVKISVPEIIFTRQLETICEGGDFWEEHLKEDKLYMYLWAKDDTDAERVALSVREEYLKNPRRYRYED